MTNDRKRLVKIIKGMTGSNRKAMAYLLYLHDQELVIQESSRHYAKAWGVSVGTAWTWLKEFNAVAG